MKCGVAAVAIWVLWQVTSVGGSDWSGRTPPQDALVALDAFDLKTECAAALSTELRGLAQTAGVAPDRTTMPVRIGDDRDWKRIRLACVPQGMKP
jgi:hypothetical protein